MLYQFPSTLTPMEKFLLVYLTPAPNTLAPSPAPKQTQLSLTPYESPATSPLNLVGELERWGISATTPLTEITLKITEANGAQIKELLTKLPDGMRFALHLKKETL